MNTETRPENDLPCIHINSIPYEILGIILNECEEFSFVSQFVCKHWKETYKYLIQPEWNKEAQKRENRKQRITSKDKISLPFLKWASDDVKGRYEPAHKSINRAVLFGDMEMLKWLAYGVCPWDEWALAYAAKGGNLEIMKWFKEIGCSWDEGTFIYAAKGGNLKICKWLKRTRMSF
jgi:hypothetical protein